MPFNIDIFRFFIENPSAWSEGFDQRISDEMANAATEIERLRTGLKNIRDHASPHSAACMLAVETLQA